ncbi:MAG: hypothetical protein ACJAWO_002283 [Halieaceae bacterium]|jgi:hypothetical protein
MALRVILYSIYRHVLTAHKALSPIEIRGVKFKFKSMVEPLVLRGGFFDSLFLINRSLEKVIGMLLTESG